MDSAFRNSIAFSYSHETQAFEEHRLSSIHWDIDELGPATGAIVVERMRTFGGKLPKLDWHRKRFVRGLEVLGIDHDWELESLFGNILPSILDRNRRLLDEYEDVSVVVLASPGVNGAKCFVHASPIAFTRLKEWYSKGTRLHRSSICNVDSTNWPMDVKVRNRLQYFLADREASKETSGSLAVLSTRDGYVSDTSVANLILVMPNHLIVSPKPTTVHLGTSFSTVRSWLDEMGFALEFRDVSFDEIQFASAVLMLGNTGCLWNATQLGDVMLPHSQDVGMMLRDRWIREVGFDWYAQALRRG